MNPAIYRTHLARLSLTQEEAGLLFGASRRSGHRWAVEGPPLAVALVMILAEQYGLTVDDLRALLDTGAAPREP